MKYADPPCGPKCCTYYIECQDYKPKKHLKDAIKRLKKELKELKNAQR